jgi:chemotaxis protein methyltransferase CheR
MPRAEGRSALDPGAVRRFGELVRARTRLTMRPRNLEIVVHFVERRAVERGMSADAYVEHVILAHDAAEIDLLIAELTVGETHFFRGPPQFEALRHEIVPALVQKRRKERAITALSAGCATGEEAYSLAIVLQEGAPNAAWRVEVTGIDINARSLQKAESARYSAWSLRDVSDAARRRYFRTDGDAFELVDDLRRLVRFRRRGLTEAPLAKDFSHGLDLVVCQNVLYYLEPEVRPDVIASLADALAPGGFLLLGPVDHAGDVPGCRASHVGEVVVYERTGPVSVAPPSPRARLHAAWERRNAPSVPPLPAIDVGMASWGVAEKSSHEPEPEPPQAATFSLENAFALADAGDLDGAITMINVLLEEAPEEPKAHLLEGLLLIELGRLDAALDAFRRCVYLDPSMMLAHAGAAVAGLRLGRSDLVERHAARLRALAKEKNVDAPIEGWDGMTVGRLLRLFRDSDLHSPRGFEGLSR